MTQQQNATNSVLENAMKEINTIKADIAKVQKEITPTAKIDTKIVASKKTFKAKAKTKKYVIKLKTKTGKAIKGMKVTLKIKGKTYKAKTNSKGKATFKISKLNKKGKYTAKITFAGNSNYKGSTKTVKISIK